MYRVVLSKIAEKDLESVDKNYKPHIFAALFELRKDAYLGKKLKGKFGGYYSLRVGSYRIIYKVYKNKLTVLVIRISPRQGVYKI